MPQLLFKFKRNGHSVNEEISDNLIQVLNQRKITYDKVQKHDDDTVGVEFSNPEEAKKAFTSLDGIELMGTHVAVKSEKIDRENDRRGKNHHRRYNNYNNYNGFNHYQNFDDVYDNRCYNRQQNYNTHYNDQTQYNFNYNTMQQRTMPINVEQYPCRILIPSTMVKVLLGKAGLTINAIQTKTNTKIDVHRDKSTARSRLQEDILTTIKGSPESFSEAIQELLAVMSAENEKLASDENRPLQLKLLAHDLLCGRIIGKGGNNLKQLKQESGVTKLIISNSLYEEGNQFSPGGIMCTGERVVTIEGTVTAISAAEGKLSKKLRDYMDKDRKNPGYTGTARNMVGSPYMNGGVNNGCMTYPQLYQRNAYPNQYAYMSFPAYAGCINPNYPGILGHGYPPYGGNLIPQPLNNDDVETICMFIPSKEVGAVIGRNGDYISRVKGYSGARVRVVKDGEEVESKVEITAPPDGQWRASLCIFSKIKETMKVPYSEAQLKTEYTVPGSCVGRIIGQKGLVVKDIQNKAQAEIEVPKDKQGGQDVPVYITGTFNGTQIALNRIREIVQRALSKPT